MSTTPPPQNPKLPAVAQVVTGKVLDGDLLPGLLEVQ